MSSLNQNKPWNIELNSFCMLMHVSQLSSVIIPGLGLILPILMWATNKDEFPVVDEHGKRILNWMISALIYSVVCGVLVLIVFGIFGLFAIGIATLIFAIIGAIKANKGEVWAYPLSINFFKVDE